MSARDGRKRNDNDESRGWFGMAHEALNCHHSTHYHSQNMTFGMPKHIPSRTFFRLGERTIIFFLTYRANNLIYESHCGLV
jgi:hypothetical protein